MTGIDSPGNASTLSILIDESGDMYAPYRIGSMTDRYYLFALVFHDQTDQMQFPDFRTFDERIRSLNSSFGIDPDAPIHTGNLIRRENHTGGLTYEAESNYSTLSWVSSGHAYPHP